MAQELKLKNTEHKYELEFILGCRIEEYSCSKIFAQQFDVTCNVLEVDLNIHILIF